MMITTDLECDYESHISKTNWQDEIFGEEWTWGYTIPIFLSPTDQKKVVNSIKNNYPDRDWSNKKEVTESWFNQYNRVWVEHPWQSSCNRKEKILEKKIHVPYI